MPRAPKPVAAVPDTSALADHLTGRLEVGDVVLTGAADPVSLIIQTGSRSPYSHVGLVIGDGLLLEAYDYALTPDESDEGIFPIPLGTFLARSRRLRIVEVRRPRTLDRGRLVDAAAHLERHSPGFPTIGMVFLALCGLSAPALRRLPDRELRDRLAIGQAALAADGNRRMHCAEAVTRLYYAAGVPLRFRTPRLWDHIEALTRMRPPWHLVDLPTERRTASAGRWPRGHRATRVALSSSLRVYRERRRSRHPIDVADLILPGDYARAEPFVTVGRYRRRSRGWVRPA